MDQAQCLLAVDLGLRTGLALYRQDGRLCWYRSHHFASLARLRRGVHNILNDIPNLAWLILEGGGSLADVWQRAAQRRGLPVRLISAEAWRCQFLYPRQQRNGAQAKEQAITVARAIITWSGARRPTSLQDDAAEAILIGLWGVLDVGWLPHIPDPVRR